MAIGRHPGKRRTVMTMARQYQIDDLVDIATYPLDQPNSVAYKSAVA